MNEHPITAPGFQVSVDQLNLEASLGKRLSDYAALISRLNQGLQQSMGQIAERDAEIERLKRVNAELEERLKRLQQPRPVEDEA